MTQLLQGVLSGGRFFIGSCQHDAPMGRGELRGCTSPPFVPRVLAIHGCLRLIRCLVAVARSMAKAQFGRKRKCRPRRTARSGEPGRTVCMNPIVRFCSPLRRCIGRGVRPNPSPEIRRLGIPETERTGKPRLRHEKPRQGWPVHSRPRLPVRSQTPLGDL